MRTEYDFSQLKGHRNPYAQRLKKQVTIRLGKDIIEYFKSMAGQKMKRILMAVFALMLLAGCAKLEHLDQLLTLKDLSEEGDRQDRYVQDQDRKFGLLLEAVQSNTLSQHAHQKKIVKVFGDPAYREEVDQNGQLVEKWLYRYTKEFFDSEKVYLYFDREGKLINWEYFPDRKEAEILNEGAEH